MLGNTIPEAMGREEWLTPDKAYDCDTYEEAKAALESLKPELKLMNQSAVASLEEGLEETLTLHRLGMLPFLKRASEPPTASKPSTA